MTAGSTEGMWTRLLTSKATPQLICRSRYHIQSGIKRPLPARLLLRLWGWLRAGVERGAGLGTLLAGCLRVCVPRPVPVGAVARGPLINGHTLARWDHLVSSKTVGPCNQQRITKSRQDRIFLRFMPVSNLWPVLCAKCEERSNPGDCWDERSHWPWPSPFKL